MNRSIRTRGFAILLSLAVMIVFSFAMSAEVYAASKKTVYVVTSETHTYQFAPDDVEKWTYKNTYFKTGLLKQSSHTRSGGGKTIEKGKAVYQRNAKGAPTTIKQYLNGSVTFMTKNTVNKKGRITKSKGYNVANGKKTLAEVTNNTYWSNGKLKKAVTKGQGEGAYTYTATYRKNGTIKKSVNISDYGKYTTTYNKKGRATKEVYTYGSDDWETSGTITYTYKTNKKGHVTKEVSTDKSTFNGETSKTVTTTKNTYKYDSHGNITKQTTTITRKNGDNTSTTKNIHTYKYKKMKIAKKYLPYI